jgi:hypothetical protein
VILVEAALLAERIENSKNRTTLPRADPRRGLFSGEHWAAREDVKLARIREA